MAFIQTDFYSEALCRHVSFTAFIPNDINPMFKEGNKHYAREMKALYLLHGYSASNKDWFLGSCVQELAIRYNIAVICPTGENSFYLNGKGKGRAYGDFVGKELVNYTRKLFGLSSKKEDTFIGGLSMGGFGAIHVGLSHPDHFSKIIALSSALIIHNVAKIEEGMSDGIADFDYYTNVFGNLREVVNSHNNPEVLIKGLKECKEVIPNIFMACGTEDFLLQENRQFYAFLQQEDVKVTYTESSGAHDWTFWNAYLEPAIKWLTEVQN